MIRSEWSAMLTMATPKDIIDVSTTHAKYLCEECALVLQMLGIYIIGSQGGIYTT
jgi:hypothetical protein